MANEKSICPSCKTKLEGNSKFCPECGANLEEFRKAEELRSAEEAHIAEEFKKVQGEKRFCINCGVELETDMFFCPECGTKIELVMEDSKNVIMKKSISEESENTADNDESSVINQVADTKEIENSTQKITGANGIDDKKESKSEKKTVAVVLAYLLAGLIFWGFIIYGGVKVIKIIYPDVKAWVQNKLGNESSSQGQGSTYKQQSAPSESDYITVTLQEYNALTSRYSGKRLKFENLTLGGINENFIIMYDDNVNMGLFANNFSENDIRKLLNSEGKRCVIYAKSSGYNLYIERISFY